MPICHFISAWLDSCLHGSGLKGALSYRQCADCDNSIFPETISKYFTPSAWSNGSPYISLCFSETRGLAGLQFLSCAANVQGTHRLPVTSVPVLCFIVEKWINLFKLLAGCVVSLVSLNVITQTTYTKKSSWKDYKIYFFILIHCYINFFLWT